jgi:hypothetical protein
MHALSPVQAASAVQQPGTAVPAHVFVLASQVSA